MAYLHLDCPSGMGGDMFLAACAGLGVEMGPLQQMLQDVGLNVTLAAERETRSGMAGWRMHVEAEKEQPLRHLADLLGLVERMAVSGRVKAQARAAFERLAQAEASVHGTSVDRIHFHEVGAVDTLADVVGAFWALERLGVDRVTCSPLPWFQGTVVCAHGLLPLPAPATVLLLQGKPVYPTDKQGELITPTGALIIDQVVDCFAPGPCGVLAAQSTAYGAKDFGPGLRAFLVQPSLAADTADAHGRTVERVWVLETHVDHLCGEDLGACFEALFQAGALDVFFAPGVMKKNRPGGALTVLCAEAGLAAVERALFVSTLTLGVRRTLTERVALPRHSVVVDTPFGPVEAKEVMVDGLRLVAPEYESLASLAAANGRSVAAMRRLVAPHMVISAQEA